MTSRGPTSPKARRGWKGHGPTSWWPKGTLGAPKRPSAAWWGACQGGSTRCPSSPLPASVEEARDIALANSPDLLAARYDEKAADEQVTVAKRERFGEANVNSTFAYQAIRGGPLAPFLIDGLTATIGVNMSIPIFSSGLVAARVRQAQAAQSEALERIEGTARAVTEATINAWTVLKAAEILHPLDPGGDRRQRAGGRRRAPGKPGGQP